MRLTYAVRTLAAARGRMAISLFGIAFAAFLMAVQGSLLYGFSLAASRIIDAVDADLWIVASKIPAFEFVSTVEERHTWIARGVSGVAETGRGIAGWAPFQKENGDRTFVFAVAVEDTFRGKLPDVETVSAALGGRAVPIQADKTEIRTLAEALPARVQVATSRADLVAPTEGFASFLGPPFIFARLADVRRFLPYGAQSVSFVLARTDPAFHPEAVRDDLRLRLRGVDVWTKTEFSRRSRVFWLVKTGAGGALTLAAVLGFVIGLSVVAQTIYSLTSENIEEYATLRAMGASRAYLKGIVSFQALICGAGGTLLGLLAVGPFAETSKAIVTWIEVPGWMYVTVTAAVALLCLLASQIAARPAVRAEPARVFRA